MPKGMGYGMTGKKMSMNSGKKSMYSGMSGNAYAGKSGMKKALGSNRMMKDMGAGMKKAQGRM